jgi:hypothetical protein
MIRLLRHAWKTIKASFCMPGDPCPWCGGEFQFVPGDAGDAGRGEARGAVHS